MKYGKSKLDANFVYDDNGVFDAYNAVKAAVRLVDGEEGNNFDNNIETLLATAETVDPLDLEEW